MAVSIDRLVAALSEPRFYAHGPETVEVVQTHISWVFLAGEEVFKLKKPVRFSFLDFSTAALRRHYCHEEVRLNRRLAADVYLDVLGLCAVGDTFAFCAADAPSAIETVVHMRRLPAARLLPALLERGEVDVAMIEAIVACLVSFHRNCDAGPEVRAAGRPQALLAAMQIDFAEMERFRGVTVAAADDDALRRFCLQGVERRAPLLQARCDAGRVRDGHGDLHAEHVCVSADTPARIVIFDCIEFKREFRCRDVAAEIAFLAMDLDFRGHPHLARHLVSVYAAQAADPMLPSLIPLFACHRAYIRGKVESLKGEELEVGVAERAAARARAAKYFDLAYRYSWMETAVLVVVYGLSGTGKSTLARALAARVGFTRFASDEIRKELAGLAPTSRVDAGARAELYSAAMSARTYGAMIARAEAALCAGAGVILDATFQRRIDRDSARRLAQRCGVPIRFVECVCPEEEVLRRLAARARADDDVSDADVDVYRAQCRVYESSNAAEAADTLRVDTSDTSVVRPAVEAFLSSVRMARA